MLVLWPALRYDCDELRSGSSRTRWGLTSLTFLDLRPFSFARSPWAAFHIFWRPEPAPLRQSSNPRRGSASALLPKDLGPSSSRQRLCAVPAHVLRGRQAAE